MAAAGSHAAVCLPDVCLVTNGCQKPDVARVEEDLVKIINGGVIEDIQEELVDYYDWMADAEHPNGIIVTDEMELIRQHPEYLTLTAEEPPSKLQKTAGGAVSALGMARIAESVTSASAVNTPIVTDLGSEVESQAGRESAQRSPAYAPTPSPNMSADEDKDVDDLEDDILGGMEEKHTDPGSFYACARDDVVATSSSTCWWCVVQRRKRTSQTPITRS